MTIPGFSTHLHSAIVSLLALLGRVGSQHLLHLPRDGLQEIEQDVDAAIP